MNKAAIGVGAIALAAVGVTGWLQHRDSVALRREIMLLRADVQVGATEPREMGTTIAADGPRGRATPDEATTVDQSELRKLREEIGALRKSTQELTQFAQAAQAAAALKGLGATETTVPTKLTAAEDLRNAGKGTPEAATETLLWAAFSGDVDTLSN